MAKQYQISDGKMVLTLQPDNDGWCVVKSPTDPAMLTQARIIDEAFRDGPRCVRRTGRFAR